MFLRGLAAYKKLILIAEEKGNWHQVPANTANLDQSGTVLDDSAHGYHDGMRSRVIGLLEWGVTMTIVYSEEGAGSDAVEMLRDAWRDRDTLYVQYMPDSKSGWEGPVVVENFNMSGGVDDLETADVNLLSAGEMEDISSETYTLTFEEENGEEGISIELYSDSQMTESVGVETTNASGVASFTTLLNGMYYYEASKTAFITKKDSVPVFGHDNTRVFELESE